MIENRDLWRYVRKGIISFIALVSLMAATCSISEQSRKKSRPFYQPPTWKGYDPTRPATDVKSLDYENNTITYRTYSDSASSPSDLPGKSHKGVTITTEEGQRVNTGLTNEELFEQLDLEYEDLFEYYMD